MKKNNQKWYIGSNKHIYLKPNYVSFSNKAASIVINLLNITLKNKEFVVLVPSAGQTPLLMYRILTTKYRNSIEWERVIVVQMDEYLDIPRSHPQSMTLCVEKYLVKPLKIKNYLTFLNNQGHLIYSLREYDDFIKSLGGIDIVIHGMGSNGHIGFNEPGSSWTSYTRIVDLSASTVESNFGKIDYNGNSYKHGITLGLGTLSLAGHAILLLSGMNKNKVTKKLFIQTPSLKIPASSLSLNPNLDIIVNQESFSPEIKEILQHAANECNK